MKNNRKYLSIFVLVLAIGMCFGLYYTNEKLKLNSVEKNVENINNGDNDIIAAGGCTIDLSEVSMFSIRKIESACKITDGAKTYDCYIWDSNKKHVCKNSSCSLTISLKTIKSYNGVLSKYHKAKGISINGCKSYVSDPATLSCSSATGSIKPTFCYEETTTTEKYKYTYKFVDESGAPYKVADKTYTSGTTVNSNDQRIIVDTEGFDKSKYEYVTWSQTQNCSNITNTSYRKGTAYGEEGETITVYICSKAKISTTTTKKPASTTTKKPASTATTTKPTPTTSTTHSAGSDNITCTINVLTRDDINGYGEGWFIYDNDELVDSGNTTFNYECKTNNCYITYNMETLQNSKTFNGIAGDGDCTTGGRGDSRYSNKLYCTNGGIKAKICYTSDLSSGGGSYLPPVVTEPPVQDKFTINVNSNVWAKGKEYMGDSISCGDKLYVTKCTDEYNSVCKVTSINGKNVSTETQIYKNDYTTSESDTGCFKDITRYISEKTYSYSNASLESDKTEVSCGTTVVFKEAIETACTSLSCKVNINDKTVYVERDKIVADKPACEPNNEDGTCTSSERVTDLKGTKNIKLCKKDDTEENRDKIVTCADDYEVSYNLVNDKCTSTSSDNCYKEYKYNCSYIKRPSVSVSAGVLGANGTGTITIYGKDNGNVGLKGYFISSGDAPTQNSDWIKFTDTSYKAYETKTAGSYFVWVLNNKNRMSFQIMGKVFDADMSTTLQTFSVSDASGNNLSMKGLDDNSVAYTGVVDSKYALLSNKLLESAEISGFESLTTAYEINVVSNKVALYATLTSNDASYVSGYEPRTIDLDYGRNVALIKIVNKKGKERTYTFIINRIDDRDGSNLLSSLTISKGKINFDSYVSSYDVSIPKNTKKVSINGTLVSDKAAFIKGYEPREVDITEDVQSVVLKVRSESGSIRSYVVTFTKNGADDHSNENSTYLSSLSVPGTQLGFNKEVYDYTISIPYDTETIPIYAFGESSKARVSISNNSGLKVGNNLIEIEVKNGNKTRIYSIHVIRKESGLDISNSNKLAMLSVKNYNINFNPDILDYVVKIKREKSLLITASPESNRADIYMVGNNDLTGFSTIRVKVIAENGLTNIYSIDIQKDPYNKTIEIIAAISGGLIFVGTAIIIVIRRKRKKMKEYLEE